MAGFLIGLGAIGDLDLQFVALGLACVAIIARYAANVVSQIVAKAKVIRIKSIGMELEFQDETSKR